MKPCTVKRFNEVKPDAFQTMGQSSSQLACLLAPSPHRARRGGAVSRRGGVEPLGAIRRQRHSRALQFRDSVFGSPVRRVKSVTFVSHTIRAAYLSKLRRFLLPEVLV